MSGSARVNGGVDDGVDTFQGLANRVEIGDVTMDDLASEPLSGHLVTFRPCLRAPVAGAQLVASRQIVQNRAPDPAGGAKHGNFHRFCLLKDKGKGSMQLPCVQSRSSSGLSSLRG